jgi:hypothetical protein
MLKANSTIRHFLNSSAFGSGFFSYLASAAHRVATFAFGDSISGQSQRRNEGFQNLSAIQQGNQVQVIPL